MRPPATRQLAPYAAAAAFLLAGWLNLARGVAHPGVPYRPWAFAHQSYSDLLAMGGDRYFNGGRPLPYLEDRIEYPVLLGLALWLPSFAPGGPLGYFTAGYLLLGVCALAAIWLLRRLPDADAWWLAGTPALAWYAGLNWDLIPIALTVGALVALARGRAGLAGALCALGVSAKLYPVALVPGAVGLLWRRPRDLARFGGAFAAALLALNLPVALAAPESFAWFFRFNGRRGAENSIWEALPLALSPAALNRITAVPLLLAAGVAGAAAWLARPRWGSFAAVRLGTALVLVTWITVNKVWSPQYALYALLAGALAAAPRAWMGALSAMAVLDYWLAFEYRARGMDRWFRDHAVFPGEWVRTALFVAFAAWLARALWRAARPAHHSPEPTS
ncbi:MAG TPA: glycosyltransferase 87 family protein [Anaeromyxobacteraceae bacterium]|jgi:hypothetical protein|nr:glycosyltransferase 87 family protein [Anaeromyxobacteraceae bacterium]